MLRKIFWVLVFLTGLFISMNMLGAGAKSDASAKVRDAKKKEEGEKERLEKCRRCGEEYSHQRCWAGAPNASAYDHDCDLRMNNLRRECRRDAGFPSGNCW